MSYRLLPEAFPIKRPRTSYLIITLLAGVLLLLMVETPLTILPASLNPVETSAPIDVPDIVVTSNPIQMGQTYTKTRLCDAEAFSEEALTEGGYYSAVNVIDGDMNTRWSSKFQDPQWIRVTLCEEKVIHRVVLHWETAYGEYYQIQVSQDGETWYKVFSTKNGDGGEDVITFDPIAARYVRMCGFRRGTQWGYSLWEFEVFETNDPPVVPIPFPPVLKGHYPRWFHKELNYWTVVGSPGNYAETLFSDDGMIGNPRNGFSLMPYLRTAGKLITALDVVTVTHSLEDAYLPLPGVKWLYGEVEFEQRVFPYEAEADDSHNYIWYRLKNKGTTTISGSLYLTVRPFQVRPPWMFGGLQGIQSVDIMTDGLRVKVNGHSGFSAIMAPDDFGAIAYEDGGIMNDIMDFIGIGILPPTRTITSPGGYSSAALEYKYSLGPGEERDFMFAIPMDKSIDESDLPSTPVEIRNAFTASRALWKENLDRVTIDLPDQYQDIVHTFKSYIAYIMVNQDGPALQPGSDNYDRSWMRDGAEMGIALLRTGHYTDVKNYLSWVADFQRADGLVPPVIDPDGEIANVNEWDSQGEFIFLVSEYYKYTKDREFLEQIFPNVVSATLFLEDLREQRLTPEYENTRFYGILVPSICHEGYPEPGKHCYWDDFWALKGWQEARELAVELERYDLALWMEEEYVDFSKDLANSIRRTMNEFCIEYIPGSADAGDFDAVSTAIAAWLTEQTDFLEREGLLPALEYTLDKYYYETFLPRLGHGVQFAYTPYEMRVAGAYLMLGQKDKALKMLDYFLRDRRPLEWNQWAEVVHPGYRDPGYVGDMPHSWIGAIYINLVRALFVHEKGEQLILSSGVDERWLEEQEKIGFAGFPTHFGNISYALSSQDNVLTASFSVTNLNPGQGFVFKSPFPGRAIAGVQLNGQDWDRFTPNEIYFDVIPEEIIVTFAPSRVYLPTVLKSYSPTVALLTHHGGYVTALSVCPFLKQEPYLRDCGRFILQRLPEGKVALVTCHNKYITAPATGVTDQEWALRQESELNECGQFTLHDLGNGKFALETCAHRYWTALDGNRSLEEQWLIIARTDQVWEWEQFTICYR